MGTICHNLKLSLSLFALLFSAVFLFGTTPVSASMMTTVLSPTGGNLTVPGYTGTNAILICPDIYTSTGFTYNGATSTKIIENSPISWFYQIAPAQGTHSFSLVASCVLFTNVPLMDYDQPFNTEQLTQAGYSFYNGTITVPTNYAENFFVLNNNRTAGYPWTDTSDISYIARSFITGDYYAEIYSVTTYVDTNHVYSIPDGQKYILPYVLSFREKSPDLSLITTDFDAITQKLTMTGNCIINGSGINQLEIVGLADNATTSQPVYPDPLGLWRGGLCDCIDRPAPSTGYYNCNYDGSGLVGTHTIAVDNTFFGTTWVTINQDFSASTSTPDWTFSYGYMSEDDPAGTAYRLACTDAEWATPDPVFGIEWLNATTSAPALNFTKISCNIKKSYWIANFSIRDQIKNAGTAATDNLQNIFPFNFASAIRNSWLQSASSTLPTSLSFLDNQETNGDITVPISPGLAGNSSSTMVIWGSSVFNTSTSTTAAFASVKAASTWAFRGLLFVVYFIIAKKVYKELNGHQDD